MKASRPVGSTTSIETATELPSPARAEPRTSSAKWAQMADPFGLETLPTFHVFHFVGQNDLGHGTLPWFPAPPVMMPQSVQDDLIQKNS
jgi:hypothetical protein